MLGVQACNLRKLAPKLLIKVRHSNGIKDFQMGWIGKQAVSLTRPLSAAGASADTRVVPADMLLLAGTCIVEEAVLTGESTPQWKAPVGAPADPSAAANGATADGEGDEVAESVGVDPDAHLNIKRDRALVLFGGTKVLQHTPDASARLKTPDGGCLAVVLRTGFETAQGMWLVCLHLLAGVCL